MAFLGVVLLALCFADEVVELEPVAAQASISCGALTSLLQTGCNSMPGCYWDGSTSSCKVDDCLSFSASTTQAQIPSGKSLTECECPATNFSWAHPSNNCGSNTYDKKDTYCHRIGSVLLDRCSYLYLYNQSSPAPFCELVNKSASVEAGSNVQYGKEKTNCATDGNGVLTNLCGCLGSWDSCTSHPKCYVAGGACQTDTCADPVSGACGTGCHLIQVYKPTINGITISGNTLQDICVNTQNTPNKCFDLVYLNHTTSTSYCLDGITPNKAQCDAVEECTLLENDSLYTNYYGTKYLCTDKDHGAPAAGFSVHIPSVLALVLILLGLIF